MNSVVLCKRELDFASMQTVLFMPVEHRCVLLCKLAQEVHVRGTLGAYRIVGYFRGWKFS